METKVTKNMPAVRENGIVRNRVAIAAEIATRGKSMAHGLYRSRRSFYR